MMDKFKKYIPNILTTLRLAAVPFFWQQFLIGNFGIATTLFATACITDAIDGNLARKWKVESRYGKIVDPIADKTLVMSALLLYAIKINPIMFISLGLEAGIALVNIKAFIKRADISQLKSKKTSAIINFILKNGNGNVNQMGRKKTVGLMTEVSFALLTNALNLPATKLVTLLTLGTATLQSTTLLEYVENNINDDCSNSNEEKSNIVSVNNDEQQELKKGKEKSKQNSSTTLKENLEKELEFLKEDNSKQLKNNIKKKNR